MRFLRNLWSLAVHPVQFFRVDRKERDRRPLPFLAISIVLACIVAWQVPPPVAAPLLPVEPLLGLCASVSGGACEVVSMVQPTGIGWLDVALTGLVSGAMALALGLAMWAFSDLKLPSTLTTAYFVYAAGVSVLLVAALQFAGARIPEVAPWVPALALAVRLVFVSAVPAWLFPKLAASGWRRVLLSLAGALVVGLLACVVFFVVAMLGGWVLVF